MARRSAVVGSGRNIDGGASSHIEATSDATSQDLSDGPELLVSADEENEDEDEGNVPSGCTCRYCHAELVVAGRLKGTPTLELLAVARLILALLPTLMEWVSAELMEQLRSGVIDSLRLPVPLRTLLNHQRWLLLELGVGRSATAGSSASKASRPTKLVPYTSSNCQCAWAAEACTPARTVGVQPLGARVLFKYVLGWLLCYTRILGQRSQPSWQHHPVARTPPVSHRRRRRIRLA